jgi:flagellar hook protein FlgE
MLGSLNSGVSGMQQFQTQLDVIGNNISNSNTIGFKSSRADVADSFSQTLAAAGGTASSVQVGSGSTTVATSTQFEQGTLTKTGLKTDLAIQDGAGFFVVKNGSTNATFATRAGDFTMDTSNRLVTQSGLRVQGFSGSDLATSGDIVIDGAGRPATSDPAATVTGWSVDSDGKINVNLSDNTTFVRGQILLQRFDNPQALTKQGNNLYGNMNAAGPLGGSASPTSQPPGTPGLGKLSSGELETSNVDLAGEFAGLITAQRGFQASARLITTSDEVLQEMVNLKH